MWVLVFGWCTSRLPPPAPPAACPPTQLNSHTTYFTHNLLTHKCPHSTCPHTTYSHTQLTHTQLAHTQLLTHNCPHTTCPHTTCPHTTCPHTTCPHTTYSHTHTQLTLTQLTHTQLAHTHLSTHDLLTHTQLVHTHCVHTQTYFTQLTHTHTQHTHTQHTHTHTQLVHTHTHTTYSHTHTHTYSHTNWRHGPSLCVADVALMAVVAAAVCVAGVARTALGWLWWRAWFPVDAVCRRGCLRGRRAHLRHWAGSGWRAWFPVGAVVAAAVCLAGVALGDIDRNFAWQAWHLATSTCILRGRRGTYGAGLALVARLVPSGRHLRHWAGSGGALGSQWAPLSLVCVGVALGDTGLHFACRCDIDVHSAWQHGTYGTGRASGGALGSEWTPLSPRLCCVAAMALGDIDLHFAWQVWHLATSTFTLRGRGGTW